MCVNWNFTMKVFLLINFDNCIFILMLIEAQTQKIMQENIIKIEIVQI